MSSFTKFFYWLYSLHNYKDININISLILVLFDTADTSTISYTVIEFSL